MPFFSLFFYAYLIFGSALHADEHQTPIWKYLQPIHVSKTPSGMLSIDCIYCINLDTRPEKWSRVSSIFEKAGLQVERVSGVNGRIISEDQKRELSGPYPVNLRGPQIGCLLSHLSILQDAYTRGWNTIWVMEDDIEFVDDIHKIPERIQELSSLDPEWDILYTDVDMHKSDGSYWVSQYYKPRPDQKVSKQEYFQPRVTISDTLMRIRQRWGTHSMIISKKGIKKILDYFHQWYLWGPIDDDLHYIPNMREYSVTKDIVTNWAKSPTSDISITQPHRVAILSNWDIHTLPAKFEQVHAKYNPEIICPHGDLKPDFSLDPSKYEKIVLFNPYFNKQFLSSLPREKLILFLWEPEILSSAWYEQVGKVYTWDDSLVDNVKFFKFYYPYLEPMEKNERAFQERKLVTMIASNWVSHRKEVLAFFAENAPHDLEFYGKSCPESRFQSMYKGSIPGYHSEKEKLAILQQYRFAFCSENTLDLKGYVTEKIFNCFQAGCVPLYRGASNIGSYVPKECFIDTRDFATLNELYQFIKTMPKETYDTYIENIQKYLGSEQAALFSQKNFDDILYKALSDEQPKAREKKTICLNMIVKNETAVIRRCLASVKPIIDYWVIVDTGSTDGTQAMIKEYMKDIPGELHERPWKNFAHNRNEALELAKGKADYCLIMDADDLLEFDSSFHLPPLTADAYRFQIVLGNTVFERVQLINMHKPWKWKGVLHEYLEGAETYTRVLLPHVSYKATRDGARSADPQKYAKDTAILKAALEDEPNNPRYMFYLAQSYKDAQEYQKAIECYEARIAMGGWREEVYWSMYQIAESKKILKEPTDAVLSEYFRAYRHSPHRSEALYAMCEILSAQQEYALSYALLESHDSIPRPKQEDILFRSAWIENWGLLFQRSISAYYIGRYQESLDLNNALLERHDVPETYKQRIKSNRVFAERALQKAA